MKRINWNKYDRLLGTDADERIAKIIGCSKKTVYKGVGSKAKAQKKQEAVSKVKKQYKTDVSEYKAYVKKSKEYTAAQIMTKCNKADKSVSSLLNSDAFKLVTVKS